MTGSLEREQKTQIEYKYIWFDAFPSPTLFWLGLWTPAVSGEYWKRLGTVALHEDRRTSVRD